MSDEVKNLEERLLERAMQAISKLLDDKAGRRDLSMTQMETLVGDLEHDFRQSVMQELVDESQATSLEECPHCRGKLRNKGQRKKRLITVRDEVEAKRDYYVCVDCGSSHFPPRCAVGYQSQCLQSGSVETDGVVECDLAL